MRFRWLWLMTLAWVAGAQTSVYLHDNSTSFQVVSPGCTNTTPIVCSVTNITGLVANSSVVSIAGVCANNGTTYISNANGLRKISTIVPGSGTTGTIALTDTSGTAIAGNGAWCDGHTASYAAGVQYGALVNAYNTVSGVRGFFDGDSGSITRQWALGTANGLSSLVVAASVATVTTSYAHGVSAGDHISVWNTTSSNLNRNGIASDYTVLPSPAPTTYTFAFATTSVSDGTYTTNAACGPGASPNGTIQGTDNCVRISQKAVTTNLDWAKTQGSVSAYLPPTYSYKFPIDDATAPAYNDDVNLVPVWSDCAVAFLVDQANSAYLGCVVYALNNLEKMSGAAFIVNEASNDGGNWSFAGNGPALIGDYIANIYTVGRGYLTSAQLTAAKGKVVNDLPDGCTKTVAAPHDTLATGTSQASSAVSLTLSAGDSAANGYYVNNVIEVYITLVGWSYGIVTAYNSTTKVATVASWSNGTPAAVTAYSIYSTVILSGTTITGYNTHFTSHVTAGDVVFGLNYHLWPGNFQPGQGGSWVATVNSDTSLTVVNMQYPNANTTPQTYIYSAKWVTGNCGMFWVQKYADFAAQGQPVSYPPNGGNTSVEIGSNQTLVADWTWTSLLIAMAGDDARVPALLAATQSHLLDYELSVSWNYSTGVTADGSNYGIGVSSIDSHRAAWTLGHNITGFPALPTGGPWAEGLTTYKMFSARSDAPYTADSGKHQYFPFWFGNQSLTDYTYKNIATVMLDHGAAWNPTAASSQYWASWKTALSLAPVDDGGSTYSGERAVKIDPRIVSSDYTVQPRQYLFTANNQSTCATLTGWVCTNNVRGDVMYSRTGWSAATDTDLFFSGRGFMGTWAHDLPSAGAIQVYKVGFLLSDDNPGATATGEDTATPDVLYAAPQFGSTSLINGTPAWGSSAGLAASQIIRWASATHGSWNTAYGDQNSRYAYALADVAAAYSTAPARAYVAVGHLKKTGTEEIIVRYEDLDATGAAQSIAVHVSYPQNGEAGTSSGSIPYQEGTTASTLAATCSSGVCTGQVTESEDGGSSNGDPLRQYNLLTRILVPSSAASAVAIHYDGTTYTGSNGHSDRLSVCADASSTGSCGATGQTKLELIEVHKVATQPDTTLTVASLNPDGNWTGFQSADKVFLHARHGSTYSTMAGFTTTHSGTAQYLFAGLTAGAYSVTVSGAAVSGSPFTVGTGDNTLYFESAAGPVVLTTSAPAVGGSVVGGTVKVGGAAIIH